MHTYRSGTINGRLLDPCRGTHPHQSITVRLGRSRRTSASATLAIFFDTTHDWCSRVVDLIVYVQGVLNASTLRQESVYYYTVTSISRWNGYRDRAAQSYSILDLYLKAMLPRKLLEGNSMQQNADRVNRSAVSPDSERLAIGTWKLKSQRLAIINIWQRTDAGQLAWHRNCY